VISSSPAKPTVYVVDDDFGVLNSLRFVLETDGFDVGAFKSGSALLDAVAAAGAGCFVIDYKMPNMSGIWRSACGTVHRHANSSDYGLPRR
jgi:two-component system response regulator FixJ